MMNQAPILPIMALTIPEVPPIAPAGARRARTKAKTVVATRQRPLVPQLRQRLLWQ
jgi:hypothetical protein